MQYQDLTLAQKALYEESWYAMTDCGPTLVLAAGTHLAKKYPHLTFMDDDWKPVSQLLLRFCANRTQPENVSRGTQNTAPASSRAREKSVVQARTVQQKLPATGIEARIRELSGERLVAVARANNIQVEIHKSNGGLTAMRRKNALLALNRRGIQVKL